MGARFDRDANLEAGIAARESALALFEALGSAEKTLHANPGMRFEVTRLNSLAILDKLRQDISASEQGRESGVIALTYENEDPILARQVLEPEAKKLGLRGLSKEELPNALLILRENWLSLVPLILLVYFILSGRTPDFAAVYGIIACVVVGFLKPANRPPKLKPTQTSARP